MSEPKHYPSRREIRIVQHVPTVGFESGRDGNPSFVHERTVSGFSPEAVQAAGGIEVQNPEDGGGIALAHLIGEDRVAAALQAAWAHDFGDPT